MLLNDNVNEVVHGIMANATALSTGHTAVGMHADWLLRTDFLKG